ncbi:hypothetical protein PTMSG1_08291 [Pyrenophora teres f. maculata]|nr:hypothetical protein PTMSG1_08291 [Pyrenophora teres f. maculata]
MAYHLKYGRGKYPDKPSSKIGYKIHTGDASVEKTELPKDKKEQPKNTLQGISDLKQAKNQAQAASNLRPNATLFIPQQQCMTMPHSYNMYLPASYAIAPAPYTKAPAPHETMSAPNINLPLTTKRRRRRRRGARRAQEAVETEEQDGEELPEDAPVQQSQDSEYIAQPVGSSSPIYGTQLPSA